MASLQHKAPSDAQAAKHVLRSLGQQVGNVFAQLVAGRIELSQGVRRLVPRIDTQLQ